MKKEKQIDQKLIRAQKRFERLNKIPDSVLSLAEREEIYKLVGVIESLYWVKKN